MFTKQNITLTGVILALVLGVLGLIGGNTQSVPTLGVDGDTNLTNLVLEGDLTVGDDTIVSGGSLTVTSTNAATSTTQVGCIQTTATTTATPIRIVFSSIATSSPSSSGINTNGLVGWQFGTCPI